MQMHYWQRALLRGSLRLGAVWGRTLKAGGLEMDATMSALVRVANRMAKSGNGDVPVLRERYAAASRVTGLLPDRTVRVTAIEAGGRPARRYEPAAEPVAKLMYFHGGGFILGSLDTHDALCRRLATRARLRIVSVDYRLAPEHPFPAAWEDAAAAWRWAQQGARGRWLVGGDSAGANLAAGLALDGSARLQLLIYPVVDMLHQDGLYPSVETFGEGYLLTAAVMQECAAILIPPGQDAGDPRLSPIRGHLGRASPALVVTAGFDPLRDQGEAYVRALQNAGVRAHLLEEPALPHGFADFAGVVPAARLAVDRIADAIGAALRDG